MKKTFCFLFLTSLLLASCSPQNEAVNERKTENKPLELDIHHDHIAEELKQWHDGDILNLELQLDQIPLDTCEKYFSDELAEFLNQYEDTEVDSVVLKQDHLSVVTGRNSKSLENLEMEVNILMDTLNNFNHGVLAEDVAAQIGDFFHQYSYYNMKVKELCVNIFDHHHTPVYDQSTTYIIGDETIFALQPGDEYAVQTAAFLYFASNSPYSLQKFGIIPETNELYVEYRIRDDAFDYRNMEKSMAELEALSHDLEEYLLSYHVTNDYISAHKITQLTIAFDIGILGEISEYPYDV